MPAWSAPYPSTVCTSITRKNSTAPSAAYTSRVIAFAAENVRDAEETEREHRVPADRLSTSTKQTACPPAPPTSAGRGERLLCHSMRQKVRPPRDRAASPAPSPPRRTDPWLRSGSPLSGTKAMLTATVPAASGALIQKIQRQSAYWTRAPADEGSDRRRDAGHAGPGADRPPAVGRRDSPDSMIAS